MNNLRSSSWLSAQGSPLNLLGHNAPIQPILTDNDNVIPVFDPYANFDRYFYADDDGDDTNDDDDDDDDVRQNNIYQYVKGFVNTRDQDFVGTVAIGQNT